MLVRGQRKKKQKLDKLNKGLTNTQPWFIQCAGKRNNLKHGKCSYTFFFYFFNLTPLGLQFLAAKQAVGVYRFPLALKCKYNKATLNLGVFMHYLILSIQKKYGWIWRKGTKSNPWSCIRMFQGYLRLGFSLMLVLTLMKHTRYGRMKQQKNRNLCCLWVEGFCSFPFKKFNRKMWFLLLRIIIQLQGAKPRTHWAGHTHNVWSHRSPRRECPSRGGGALS